MTPEEAFARANDYITKCCVHGAEELKAMLGLDKRPVLLEVGTRATRQVRMSRTTPKYLNND